MITLQTPVISTQKCTTRQFWWCSDKYSGLSPILALCVSIRSAPFLHFSHQNVNCWSAGWTVVSDWLPLAATSRGQEIAEFTNSRASHVRLTGYLSHKTKLGEWCQIIGTTGNVALLFRGCQYTRAEKECTTRAWSSLLQGFIMNPGRISVLDFSSWCVRFFKMMC